MEAEGGAPARWVPCPRCQGSGIAYCCDGEDWSGGSKCQEVPATSDKAFIPENKPVV